jgi:hypothetical protein
MKARIVIGLAVASLAGCVSVGTKVDPNVVNTFQPGVTTIAAAEAKLGQPNQTTHNSDGGTIVQYVYIKSHASGASYIPVVGIFAGKSIADNVTTTLTFDKAGKFVKSTTGEGHTEAGMGG